MSGMINAPFSKRIASASGVIGPFAPSRMILALILGALEKQPSKALIGNLRRAIKEVAGENRSKGEIL